MKILTFLFLVSGLVHLGPARAGQDLVGGMLILGHEVREFTPCGSNIPLWLHGEMDQLAELRKRYQAQSPGLYGPVYAKLSGTVADNPAPSGFAAAYDVRFEITGIDSVSIWDASSCTRAESRDRVTRAWVFECPEEETYVVAEEAGGAWIFAPSETLHLETLGNGDVQEFGKNGTSIRISGEAAVISRPEREPMQCTNNRRAAIWEKSKLNGADFRAVGNEPGWTLEIIAQSWILFIADYGEHRIEVPLPEHTTDAVYRRTRWDAGELVLEVSGQRCSDTMSGEQFESTVTVIWNGRTYRGCGRSLH